MEIFMNKNFSIEAYDSFFEAVMSLESIEECRSFFEDVLTIGELESMNQRLEVAKMLTKGENYSAISAKTGASSATISRVNKCLMYGGGGYRTVLNRAKEEKK